MEVENGYIWKVTTEGPMFHWTMIVGGVDQQSHVFVSWSVIQKTPPKKKKHANFKISCPVTKPPHPYRYGCFFSRTNPTNFTNHFNQCPAPWVPCLPVHPCSPATLPSTDGAQILRWKTVRRDCRRIKIRLQGIYGGIPKTLVLSGTRP